MRCHRCHEVCPEGESACPHCGAVLRPEDAATEVFAPSTAPTQILSPPPVDNAGIGSVTLTVGKPLGHRYHILQVLGRGGMGAVYKARDLELDRIVALKVIRPELTTDPKMLERFRREVLLASQVSHKHVVRIHDLGEADGVKFISMNYIDGQSLKDRLNSKKPVVVKELLVQVRQLAEALQAAHESGLVHRDLKPENILLDREGNAYIADFGLSRTLAPGGTVTQAGTVLGTVDYMSPEQARGETADQRSDIYSFGLILYELFTGTLPFKSDDPLSRMMQRVHKDVGNVVLKLPESPAWLAGIIQRSLERDPAARYQNVKELLRDLDQHRASQGWRQFIRPQFARVAVMLLVVAAAAVILIWFQRDRGGGAAPPASPGPAHALTAVALLPFSNAANDPSYDWVRQGLPSLLRADLLQSSSMGLVSDDHVRYVLEGLKLTDTADLRTTDLERISGVLGVENLLIGELFKTGNQLLIDARIVRVGGSGEPRFDDIRVEGAGDDALFAMVDDLSRLIRDKLGITRGSGEFDRAVKELSTDSVPALSLYTEAQSLERAGKHLEAAERLESALDQDSGFVAARASLAWTYYQLGYDDRAAAEARRAAANLEGVSDYEATRVRAIQAMVDSDLDEAEQHYLHLGEIRPLDAEPFLLLGQVQEGAGKLAAARLSLQQAVELDPKHAEAHYILGRVNTKMGNLDDAKEEFSVAHAIHLEVGNDEGLATTLNGLGNVYLDLSRFDEAARSYQDALEIRERINDRRGVSVSLGNLARMLSIQGKNDEAIEKTLQAISVSIEIGDRGGTADGYSDLGDIYLSVGRNEKALETYQEGLGIDQEIGDPAGLARAMANVGFVNAELGRYAEAFTFLQMALEKRREIGEKPEILRSLVGIGSLEVTQGKYAQALKHLLEGIQIARVTGEQTGIVVVSLELARVHQDQGDYRAALALLDEALELAQEIGDGEYVAKAQALLGFTLTNLGDFAGAGEQLKEARDMAEQMGDDATLAAALVYRGRLLLDQDQPEEARVALEKGVASATQVNDHWLGLLGALYLAEAHGSVSELEAVRGRIRREGIKPLLAPARLASAKILLAEKRWDDALQEVQALIASAENLTQRDFLFQGQSLAGRALQEQGKAEDASSHFLSALAAFEEMTRGLEGAHLVSVRSRPQTLQFHRHASRVFADPNGAKGAERLQAALGR